MTVDNFNRAQEIAKELKNLDGAIQRLERISTKQIQPLKIEDDDRTVYFGPYLIDTSVKEGIKALILSHLQGKVKQLEKEFENL